MADWYLNAFLTSWRKAMNAKYPRRGKASDGALGDDGHKKRGQSEHNPDADGSVDAIDVDVNLFGSSNDTGTDAEIAEMRKVLKEFQKQPQAQLWIFRRQIANRDIGPWRVRPYTGKNAHDHHAHMQSRSAFENQPFKGQLDGVIEPPKATVGRLGYRTLRKGNTGEDVADLQRRLGVGDDGKFGSITEAAVREVQKNNKLTIDGIAGPQVFGRLGIK